MSTYFSKLIKAGDRLREFNFRQASLYDDSRYAIDVPDAKEARIAFCMGKTTNGDWMIIDDSIPAWIHEAEKFLSEAIKENMRTDIIRKK